MPAPAKRSFTPRPVALALVGLLGSMTGAQAALVTMTSQNFTTSSGTATATCGPISNSSGSCSATGTVLTPAAQTSNFNQFDATAGVLTGVTIGLASTRTQTVSGSVSGLSFTGKQTAATASGTSGASLSALGATTSNLGGNISHSSSAAGNTTIGPSTTAPATTIATLAVGAGSLDSYAGGGTVAVTRQLSSVQATSAITNGSTLTKTTATANYSVNWEGSTSVSYSYLLHALPSFSANKALSEITLEFGTHFVGAAVADQTVSLFNLLAGDRTGLDLDAFSAFGSASPFSTDLALFAGLIAGASDEFAFSFDTSSAGVFGQQFILNLSDADVGAASTRNNYTLTVNLAGTVLAQPQGGTVPEPHMLGLVCVGLLGLAYSRRRRPV